MAERFGGKFSPSGRASPTGGANEDARPPYRDKRRTRAGGRVNFLFLAPLPLAFRAFAQEPQGLALMLLAFGLLILAAWLTREGLLAQDAYEARKTARRPAIPRKIFGSALTGLGLAIAGFAIGGGLAAPLIYGILGAGLHLFAFGPDPLRDKTLEGVDHFQTDRVARVVDEAEKHLAAMSAAIARIGDRQLERRVEQFQSTARDMFRTVEEDPRDLTAARKFLGVYLMGARDASVKFADLYLRTNDAAARMDYETLLSDLEENFAARNRKLLLDDRSDLTVEIEVLRERLERDGLHSR